MYDPHKCVFSLRLSIFPITSSLRSQVGLMVSLASMSTERAVLCMTEIYNVLSKHRLADIRMQARLAPSDNRHTQMGNDLLDHEVTQCDGDQI